MAADILATTEILITSGILATTEIIIASCILAAAFIVRMPGIGSG
ncbi:hypothetical protein [Sodalis sp. dw_96]|nr:hypothetical protein [Sodalis sp. dw_96]